MRYRSFLSKLLAAVLSLGSCLLFIPKTDATGVSDLVQVIGGIKGKPIGDLNGDMVVDHRDVFILALTWRLSVTGLAQTSPLDGEADVAVTRESIVHFDRPIDPSSLTEFAVYGSFGADLLPARQHLSPGRKTVTLFYDGPLPPSSRIRVFIDGNILRDEERVLVDADLDGLVGGIGTVDFDTLTLATVPGTSVFGRVFASELAAPKGSTQSVNVPLAGTVITVDGAEATYRAVVDTMGNFILDPAPAGRFFVHIDGRPIQSAIIGGVTTSTSYPGGPYYPYVGKSWESVAGRASDVGDVFLPLVLEGSLHPVSETEDTTVQFPDSILVDHPEYAGVRLTVPAGSLFKDDGTRGGMAGIAPVSPDRLPGTLPEGLEFPIVITVQTDGPTNFDVPAPICFPNLPDPVTGEPLPPGTQDGLYSFNHDKGIWEQVGFATVSEDGSLVCSDPGSGILAPGWHGTAPPSIPSPNGPPGSPPVPPRRRCEPEEMARQACLDQARKNFELNHALCGIIGFAAIALCAGLAVAFPIGTAAAYLCLTAALASAVACLATINNDYQMRVAACNMQCGPGGGKGVLSPGEVELPPVDDPIVEELVGILGDFSEELLPQILTASEITEESAEQVAADMEAFLRQADMIAGGDAIGYLMDYAIGKEEEINALNEDFGTAFIPPPPYPILYLAEIHRNDSILNLRGETAPNGQYLITLPRDGVLRRISFYDPRTNEYGVAYPTLSPDAPFPIGGFVLGPTDDYPDFDGDRLADVAELVVGTEVNNPDTDGDGVGDRAEIDQGTNPLDGLPVRQGVIASIDLADAVDVCAEDELAAVARGTRGISVLNVFNRMNPRIISSVDTTGRSRGVACSGNLVAVADGEAGCAIIDIVDPPSAEIIHQIDLGGNASSVVANGNLAYVAISSGRIFTIDLPSGTILDRIDFSRGVEDISLARDILAVLHPGQITLLSVENGIPQEVGAYESPQISSDSLGARIFNGFPIVYYNQTLGVYNTIDISNPTNPLPLGTGIPPPPGIGHSVAANGSGSVLASYHRSADGSFRIGLFDDSDHTLTDAILIETMLQGGNPVDVAIFNALAYVALRGLSGTGGIQVLNYLPYDAFGISPTVELTADFLEGPLKTRKGALPQIEEGKSALLIANGTDDVQIRNIEFFVNGERVKNDGGFPFEHRFTAPRLIDGETITLQARATDTGGNSTLTDEIIVALTADVTPPSVRFVAPKNGESVADIQNAAVFFDEPLDPGAVTGASIQVLNVSPGKGSPVSGGVVTYREDLSAVFVTFPDPLPPGFYRAEVGPAIADLVGNTFEGSFTWNFSSPIVTTVEGFVEFEGAAVAGAEVAVLGFVGSATTGNDGRFSIPNVAIPFGQTFGIAVNGMVGPDALFGGVSGIDPVHGGVANTGTISLGALCEPQLAQGLSPLPGVVGTISAMTNFDDGGGLDLFVGGIFAIAGDRMVQNIARWDGSKFEPLGELPFGNTVNALTVYNDGAGDSLFAGSNNVYKWTGSDWEILGAGLSGAFGVTVLSLEVFNGELYVGGSFTAAGGESANAIAKWNGTTWSAVGDPLGNDPSPLKVHTMKVFDSDLYVGGDFKMAGALETTGIVKWDGLAWSAVGGGVSNTGIQHPSIRALYVSENGGSSTLITGGTFDNAGSVSASNIAAWDGANWTPLGAGIEGGAVNSLVDFNDGFEAALYAGGDFVMAGTTTANHIAKWDGQEWSEVGPGVTGPEFGAKIQSLQVFDDGTGPSLYAGGNFDGVGSVAALSIAQWDGADWSSLSDGFNAAVNALTVYDDGTGPTLIAAGDFTHNGNTLLNSVASRVGESWAPLGDGIQSSFGMSGIRALAVYDGGGDEALIAGGSFLQAGTASVNRIAKWDGMKWSPLGDGLFGDVNDLVVFNDGGGTDLYAVGDFTMAGGNTALRIAGWDGDQWSPVGKGFNASVLAVEVYDDGTGEALYAAGHFTLSGTTEVNRIAKWNGSSWESLGVGMDNRITHLAVYDDGSRSDLFARGNFNTAGGLTSVGLAQWDGNDWSPVGTDSFRGEGPMIAFDDGTGPVLIVSHIFFGSVSGKWDGTNLTTLGNDFPSGGLIQTFMDFDDGTGPSLFMGGSFHATDDIVSGYFGKYSRSLPPCE